MKFLLAGIAAVSLMAGAAAIAKPTPPTIAQLAANPKFSSFDVSPDGKHLVALQAFGDDRHVLVWSTDNLQAKPIEFGATDMRVVGVQFVKNDVLAVSLWQRYDARLGLSVDKLFINKLMFVDLDGRNWRDPIPKARANTDVEARLQALSNPQVLSSLPDDPDHILVMSGPAFEEADIYKVSVHRPFAERVLRTEPETGDYIADRAGNIRIRSRFGEDNGGAYVAMDVRAPNGGAWKEAGRSYVKDRDTFSVLGFADDPNIAIVATNIGQDKIGLYEFDTTTLKLGAPILKHQMFDASNAITYRYGGSQVAAQGEILGVTYEGPNGGDVIWANPTFQALDKQIRAALGITQTPVRFVDTATGKEVTQNYDATKFYRITSYSADLSKIVIRVEGSATPPEYYLLNNGKLSLLAKTAPEIDTAALGETKLVYYKARDGMNIPAFLTTPNVELCGAGPWKAVVHPHGGPWARDEMNYDWSGWVPLMASRCMAVLRPQYRGSDGWGRALWKAGDREWGQKMQDDKDDGAQWMIDQKIAQPGHMAMFGFSYGGYAAMAAAVRPNGLYKCAISGAGVSDIKRIWRKYYDNAFFRDRQMGTVKGLNPVDFADQIKIPIMVYQGDRDDRVPVEQAEWFVDKAKKSGQVVEYHFMPDYAHGPAWTRAIFAQQLTYIDDWFKTGCGGGGL
ncbi:prolyl oligopeptidase family serine peptidase [Novosphingobium sp. FSY-8]|uniref:Prolyl oligopeptidase family serine peptidase n=2 Tax=Novosphingobium ovatum TaxID=1908523 RepID=A0ABW9X9K4_9SPHN|nr:prolyl oligopeptidase family serine peptidase [Novosphingobium ovatum]